MNKLTKILTSVTVFMFVFFMQAQSVFASEADLIVPDFKAEIFSWKLLLTGLFLCKKNIKILLISIVCYKMC